MIGSRRLLAFVALPLFACAGGGGTAPPSPVPRGLSELDRCPAPLLRAAGESVVRRVRVVNRTGVEATVFVDRCFRHTRVVDVPPGAERLARLPDELIVFPEGLRFHAFDLAERAHLGVFTVEPDDRPVYELVLDDGLAVPDSVLVPLVFDPSHARVGSFVVEPGRFAAIWARGTMAVLTWACDGDARRHLTLSTGDTFAGEHVAVQVRVDRGDFVAAGGWSVARDVTDALRAPAAEAERVTERARGATTLAVLVAGDAGVRRVHEFGVTELREALTDLACWP